MGIRTDLDRQQCRWRCGEDFIWTTLLQPAARIAIVG
jgi:hypothetical protein